MNEHTAIALAQIAAVIALIAVVLIAAAIVAATQDAQQQSACELTQGQADWLDCE